MLLCLHCVECIFIPFYCIDTGIDVDAATKCAHESQTVLIEPNESVESFFIVSTIGFSMNRLKASTHQLIAAAEVAAKHEKPRNFLQYRNCLVSVLCHACNVCN